MSSTNFTVPKGVKKIDCFCVGGGGGGIEFTFDGEREIGGCGGGGGYTTTKLGASVTPGQQISVVVGAGGVGGDIFNDKGGNQSSIGGICSAKGAEEVKQVFDNNSGYAGGNGGSGGGVGSSRNLSHPAGHGGRDGGDGFRAVSSTEESHYEIINGTEYWAGRGQGTTTRYFGESNGTLYSTGGNGGVHASFTFAVNLLTKFLTPSLKSPTANTGDGEDGGTYLYYDNGTFKSYIPSAGASGICIIRWGKQ